MVCYSRPSLMIIESRVNVHLALCLNSILNVKDLVGAFSAITNLQMNLFQALLCTVM